MAYGKRVITSYRVLPPKWRIVQPEGSELPPTQRYLRDVDRRLDELQPQRDAAHYALYDLASLVFANQTAEHAD